MPSHDKENLLAPLTEKRDVVHIPMSKFHLSYKKFCLSHALLFPVNKERLNLRMCIFVTFLNNVRIFLSITKFGSIFISDKIIRMHFWWFILIMF